MVTNQPSDVQSYWEEIYSTLHNARNTNKLPEKGATSYSLLIISTQMSLNIFNTAIVFTSTISDEHQLIQCFTEQILSIFCCPSAGYWTSSEYHTDTLTGSADENENHHVHFWQTQTIGIIDSYTFYTFE